MDFLMKFRLKQPPLRILSSQARVIMINFVYVHSCKLFGCIEPQGYCLLHDIMVEAAQLSYLSSAIVSEDLLLRILRHLILHSIFSKIRASISRMPLFKLKASCKKMRIHPREFHIPSKQCSFSNEALRELNIWVSFSLFSISSQLINFFLNHWFMYISFPSSKQKKKWHAY